MCVSNLGPLIKTIVEIIHDIRGFVCLLVVLIYGFSIALALTMPGNKAFMGTAMSSAPILTLLEAILGGFDMDDYTNSLATSLFLLFLFLVVVVMLKCVPGRSPPAPCAQAQRTQYAGARAHARTHGDPRPAPPRARTRTYNKVT